MSESPATLSPEQIAERLSKIFGATFSATAKGFEVAFTEAEFDHAKAVASALRDVVLPAYVHTSAVGTQIRIDSAAFEAKAAPAMEHVAEDKKKIGKVVVDDFVAKILSKPVPTETILSQVQLAYARTGHEKPDIIQHRVEGTTPPIVAIRSYVIPGDMQIEGPDHGAVTPDHDKPQERAPR